VPQHRGVGGQAVDQLDDLGDVDRLVTDAFEVQVDVQQRRQQPQVRGDRGLQRDQVEDAPLHVEVEPVDPVVAGDHLLADRQVAGREGLQRLLQQQPGAQAHALHLVLDLVQLLVKSWPTLTHRAHLPVPKAPDQASHGDTSVADPGLPSVLIVLLRHGPRQGRRSMLAEVIQPSRPAAEQAQTSVRMRLGIGRPSSRGSQPYMPGWTSVPLAAGPVPYRGGEMADSVSR
jgi:hypothetical protein